MDTHKVKQKEKHEPLPEQEESLAFWDLCRKSNSSPQLVNKYQRLGIVRAPGNRRRGRRQLYDSGAFGEVIAANFMKQFFALREVAEIRKLEQALSEIWMSDAGKVMNRVGDALCWKFFFVIERRFSFYRGWETTAEGMKLLETLKRYNKFRALLVERLNPLGARMPLDGWEDSLLKRALSGPLPVDEVG